MKYQLIDDSECTVPGWQIQWPSVWWHVELFSHRHVCVQFIPYVPLGHFFSHLQYIHCSWVRIGIWLCLFAVWIVPHSTMYKYAITGKLFIRTRTDLQRAVFIYSLVLSRTQCPCASYISKHSNTCIPCPANKRTRSFWEGTCCNRLLVLKIHLH